MINVHAWLDRHPTASVLTTDMVDDQNIYLVDDEYQTRLEQWESEITAVVWHMMWRRRPLEEIRRYLLIRAHPTIENVSVWISAPKAGCERAIGVSFKYHGRYHRTQVFHLPPREKVLTNQTLIEPAQVVGVMTDEALAA